MDSWTISNMKHTNHESILFANLISLSEHSHSVTMTKTEHRKASFSARCEQQHAQVTGLITLPSLRPADLC